MRPPYRDVSRILIGPVEVAGVARGLQEGLTQIGVVADLVMECKHPFEYDVQEPALLLIRWWQWAGTQARRISMRWLPLKVLVYVWHLLLCWPVLFWALARYDAFVFLAGKTLTNTSFELWLMRILRKPAVVIFLGSDARPPYINGAWKASTAVAMERATRRLKRKVCWAERNATVCINAPGTSHFHESRVINWFAFGLPCSVPQATDAAASIGSNELPSGSIRVVHSPSNPTVKGTVKIRAAIERLQQSGVRVELITLSGLSNAKVIEALRNCDLVVDQLYSDTPMAGFATEAALLGKPTLVGGYFARKMPEALEGLPMPPTRFVAPELFEQALGDLARSADARADLSSAALHFVQTEWSCRQVAARLLRIIRGDIPEAWWLNPAGVEYLAGCGLSEEAAQDRIRQLIDHAGISALQLADKPALEAAFVNWVKSHPQDSAVDWALR